MMNHSKQINNFYQSISEHAKKDLCEAIAEDIYFLSEDLQKNIIILFDDAAPEIAEKIRKINNFTI